MIGVLAHYHRAQLGLHTEGLRHRILDVLLARAPSKLSRKQIARELRFGVPTHSAQKARLQSGLGSLARSGAVRREKQQPDKGREFWVYWVRS